MPSFKPSFKQKSKRKIQQIRLKKAKLPTCIEMHYNLRKFGLKLDRSDKLRGKILTYRHFCILTTVFNDDLV